MGYRYVIIPDLLNEPSISQQENILYKDFNFESLSTYTVQSLGLTEIGSVSNYHVFSLPMTSSLVKVKSDYNQYYLPSNQIVLKDEHVFGEHGLVLPVTESIAVPLVPPAQLADADSHFVAVDGLQVHYKLAGNWPGTQLNVGDAQRNADAPVFLLLHGFGASVFTWRSVMREFAADGPVVAYDRTAFGLTERPLTWTGDNPYGTAAQVSQARHQHPINDALASANHDFNRQNHQLS